MLQGALRVPVFITHTSWVSLHPAPAAAYRDFTCNALFFEPTLDEHVPQQQPQQPQQPQPQYQNASAAADTAAPSTSTTSTPDTTTSTPSTPTTHTSTPTTTTSARPVAPAAHLQPAGRVKDYVGGLVDLAERRLRVYGGHERLGLRTSSVEVRLGVCMGVGGSGGGGGLWGRWGWGCVYTPDPSTVYQTKPK